MRPGALPAALLRGVELQRDPSDEFGPLASAWVLLPLIPFGWLGWTAFLYTGLRARKRSWLAWAGGYFVAAVVAITTLTATGSGDGVNGPVEGFGATLTFVTMAVTFIHSLVIRRPYLRRLALLRARESHEHRLEGAEMAMQVALEDPARAKRMGIGRPDLPGAFHGGLVDVNSAPAEQLARLPGITPERAIEIATARTELRAFSSLEDMGSVLDLPAPEVEELRGHVVFLPR